MEYSSKMEKRSIDLMLGLNAAIDPLVWSCVRMENGHVLRRAFDFEVEGQRKKGRPKRTWRKQIEE